MTSAIRSRLARLEALNPEDRCPACSNSPSRIAFVHGDDDVVDSENMPEDGCPLCGRAPFRTVLVHSDTPWDDPLPNLEAA